jgi:hypothetical protein
VFAIAVVAASLVSIAVGIAQIFLPAAFIFVGLCGLAAATFEPERIGRLTWPR